MYVYIQIYIQKKIEFEILYLGMSFKLFEWYYIYNNIIVI